MPVLEPNPQNGQKKFLIVLGAMLGITAVIAVIASSPRPDRARRGAGVGLTPASPRGRVSGSSGWVT